MFNLILICVQNESKKNKVPDAVAREIKRKTRCKFTSEERIQIVLDGLLGGGKKRLNGIDCDLWRTEMLCWKLKKLNTKLVTNPIFLKKKPSKKAICKSRKVYDNDQFYSGGPSHGVMSSVSQNC